MNESTIPGPLTETGGADEPGPAEPTLVDRARRRDKRAFEQLYRRHAARIHALCRRLVARDSGLAEECTQDAFIRAWDELGRFRGDSAFGSWLYRIAVNTCLAALRKTARRDRRLTLVDRLPESAETAFMETHAEGIDLERLIPMLPDGARTVYVLHDVEGWRHAEIAAITGRSEGTCKAQLHRARRLLRERLTR